jgi:hypothetical protein
VISKGNFMLLIVDPTVDAMCIAITGGRKLF